ncbi:hypothetical protein ABID65_006558 [Bradyrhizobium sp. S3.9.2]|uniref:hypothetical protein n=1 Tax=Bradyrhizobium sp. S3.9.2 TaxID=3156432 RepID=UPI0033953512
MICAISPLSMAHQWRKRFAPMTLVRLTKNQWRIGVRHLAFLTAHQWRNGAQPINVFKAGDRRAGPSAPEQAVKREETRANVVARSLLKREIQPKRATTMFIRFRQTKTRLQASLLQSHRADGKVRHEHIAMLGTVDAPPSVAGRIVFWQRLHERMTQLGNRIDAAAQAKLLGDIHARIPMVTPDEQRTLQLDNAKADAQAWDTIADLHAGTAGDHEHLIANAERVKATAAAEQAKAAAEAARAKDRIARIERGDNIDGGLGKPLTVAELIESGFTKAELEHFRQVNEVSNAFGFDTMLKAIREANDRAERSTLRALHRLIPDEDGDG